MCAIPLEAGGVPPRAASMPAAGPVLGGGAHDWGFTASAGGGGGAAPAACLAAGGRAPATRGRCLGGSSVLNYLTYVRGHARDYDAWAAAGAGRGWSAEAVAPCDDSRLSLRGPSGRWLLADQ